MISRSLFSSACAEWATPQKLFDELDREFGFTLDVCASEENHKCPRFYSKKDNALELPWQGVCWMNPPYGRTQTGKWIAKASAESKRGSTVVCLIPARTDTRWFHEFIYGKAEVRFIKGRLKFEADGLAGKNSAPFPSMIVIFRPKPQD